MYIYRHVYMYAHLVLGWLGDDCRDQGGCNRRCPNIYIYIYIHIYACTVFAVISYVCISQYMHEYVCICMHGIYTHWVHSDVRVPPQPPKEEESVYIHIYRKLISLKPYHLCIHTYIHTPCSLYLSAAWSAVATCTGAAPRWR
jgi:hypothetical protein